MRPIILASSSIYRKELLERLKIPFTTHSSDIDESPLPGEPIPDMVLRLSQEKALAASIVYPDAICIGSDEVAGLNNTILGKPLTHQNATKQLQSMRDKKIIFYTGVCVVSPHHSHIDTRMSETAVTFKNLTDKMIENYLNKEKPYHSAASFKSETLGSALIDKMECDDPTAIIGLPLIVLCDMLRAVGVEII